MEIKPTQREEIAVLAGKGAIAVVVAVYNC
jgi:hypothetical protein